MTDAASRSTSIDDASTPSTPSTAASTSARRSARRGHDPAPLLPRVAGHHEQHAVEVERRSGSRPRRRCARRARDRTCRRARPAARLPMRPGSLRAHRCLHTPLETFASSSPVPSSVSDPRARSTSWCGSGSPTGPARSGSSRRASVRSTATSSASTCSSRATAWRSTSSRWSCATPTPLDLLVREIEEVDGASVEEVRTVEHFPDPAPRRARVGGRAVRAPSRSTTLHETLVGEIRAEFLADWSALLAPATASRVERRADPRSVRARSARQRDRRRRRCVADGTTGPDDLAVASLADHDARAARRARRSPVPPARAGAARRARRHRRPHLDDARGLTSGHRSRRARRLHPGPARDRPSGAARRAATDADQVVPVFVLDDAILSSSFNRPNRTGFLLESLDDLGRALAALGAPLVIRRGDWTDEVMRLARDVGADAVHLSADVSGYAQRRERRSRTRASRRGSSSRPTRAPPSYRPGRSSPAPTASTTRCSRRTTGAGWRRPAGPWWRHPAV